MCRRWRVAEVRSQKPEVRTTSIPASNSASLMESRKKIPNQKPSLASDFWLCLLASRKEVIQPQVPLRLPCYDFTPVADLTVVGSLPSLATGVAAPPSGKANSHGVTGGVYKARERIHRGMLIRDY